MAKKRKQQGRRARANNLCSTFNGTDLARCARAGLEVLEAGHRTIITSAGQVACGVAIDRCLQPQHPDERRWDYVFTFRTGDVGVAIEVHHADADQVRVLIEKKQWTERLLATLCPDLSIALPWIWVASPPDSVILFDQLHPANRQLADAGISFPMRRCPLP
jgi:hypothetical protein